LPNIKRFNYTYNYIYIINSFFDGIRFIQKL